MLVSRLNGLFAVCARKSLQNPEIDQLLALGVLNRLIELRQVTLVILKSIYISSQKVQ